MLDGSSYGPEQQELALESLLEFTREPALMTDVYINYDCDVQCTNLFETICHSLSTHALPRDGMVSEMSRIRTSKFRSCLEHGGRGAGAKRYCCDACKTFDYRPKIVLVHSQAFLFFFLCFEVALRLFW